MATTKRQPAKRARRVTPPVPGNPAPTSRVDANRNAMTPTRLRQRRKEGTLTGDEQAFIRVGKGVTRILTGQDDLSGWDDEELRQGRRRNPQGRFSGKKMEVVPKALHDELVRRQMSKAVQLLNENLCDAVEVLTNICKDPQAENSDKIKAAKIIIERVMGKTPEKIELKVDAPWVAALQAGIVSVSNVIDVEAEDEDD